MTVRVARAAILVLGSVSLGFWVTHALSPLTLRFLLPSTARSVADVERAVALAPWVTGIPRFVGAGLAGLVLGYVMQGHKLLVWICGLLVVMVFWFYGLQFLQGSSVAGGIVTSIAQALVASVAAVGCLGLGRLLRSHEPVA
jgi:hypothetical protein